MDHFLASVRLCSQIFLHWFFLWELGYPDRIESGSSTLRGEMGAILFVGCVLGPFVAQGAQGEEEYP
jgi:hypothetical protein